MNLGIAWIKMDELRAHFEAMNFTAVETFIASGNVIFETRMKVTAKLADTIQRHLHTALGYEVDTFIRTRAELAAIAAFQPFSARRCDA